VFIAGTRLVTVLTSARDALTAIVEVHDATERT
jgi:hypothetical protein